MSIAFVFPGQGSQSLGMLSDMASAHPQIEQTFAEASGVLGYDLWALTQQGPEEKLNQTEQTQPAMLAAGVAVWRVWRSCGGAKPALLAGHSLGEYSALVCAASLDFTTAVALVAARGRFMQEAVPAGEGAIAAVLGLDDAQVLEACGEAMKARPGEVAAAVNYNAPGQVVVAGNAEAVARALEAAKEKGARRAVTLP
ncbi:MAG: acyltransferase domain-containing protein, partial [Gammaproteobacteria bacterium]|nr:acyltransferase domain-containing protein [Gammaproteobacteria bacterium]